MQDPDVLSVTLSALADPTRRAILARLAEGEATVNEIARPFDISLPAVSRHLKVLEAAGLISRGREAQWRPCRLEAGSAQERRRLACALSPLLDGKLRQDGRLYRRAQRQGDRANECQHSADDELLITRTFDAPASVLFALWSEARAHEALDGACEFHLPRSGDRFPRRRHLPRDDQVRGARRKLVRRRVSRDRAGQAVRLHLHLGQ